MDLPAAPRNRISAPWSARSPHPNLEFTEERIAPARRTPRAGSTPRGDTNVRTASLFAAGLCAWLFAASAAPLGAAPD